MEDLHDMHATEILAETGRPEALMRHFTGEWNSLRR